MFSNWKNGLENNWKMACFDHKSTDVFQQISEQAACSIIVSSQYPNKCASA